MYNKALTIASNQELHNHFDRILNRRIIDDGLVVHIDPANASSLRGGLTNSSNKFYNIVNGNEIAELDSDPDGTLIASVDLRLV